MIKTPSSLNKIPPNRYLPVGDLYLYESTGTCSSQGLSKPVVSMVWFSQGPEGSLAGFSLSVLSGFSGSLRVLWFSQGSLALSGFSGSLRALSGFSGSLRVLSGFSGSL